MKIDRFEIVDRCLFWKEKRILIIGDLHLGFEEYLNETGWSIPKTQLNETINILKKILKKTGKLSKLILLGDVKHYFAGILKQEFDDFYEIIKLIKRYLRKQGEIIITKGNHDNILEPVIKRFGFDFIKLAEYKNIDDVLFLHGNKRNFDKYSLKIFDKKIKILVIGHFHPAISLKEDVKRETYKCFVYGKIKRFKKNTIIIPSFFPLIEGTDILSDSFIRKWFNVPDLDVFVLDSNSRIYDFGNIKDMKS